MPAARRPAAVSPRCSPPSALEHPRIEIREGVRVLAPWIEDGRCVGVLTGTGGVRARATLIATGGYAALWEPTTNPLGAIGEGIAMAYRAGAAVADLEFMQFHPTAVAGSGFLLSEALRGEGAVLRDDHGERFVDELAERDVVARAIAARGSVGLDLRTIERDRFSSLMATLERDGYDPALAPIPVSPAAHYSIGGIVTDIDGHTSVPGLYAAGECSCTGVHGANRLASNSLLECLVFGRRAALASQAEPVVAETRIRAACGSRSRGRDARAPPRDVDARRADQERRGARAAPPGAAPARPSARRERARPAGEPRRPLPLGLPARRRCLRGAHRPAARARDRGAGMAVTSAPALDAALLAEVVARALAEDIGSGDRTTDAIVPAGQRWRARLLLEQAGVVAGMPVAEAVFKALDPDLEVRALVAEGARIADPPAAVAELEGPARALLTGERVALNLFARMCGIATLTRRYVDLVEGTGATILDTRKTTPGLRALEKYAVRCGGGSNHRMGLDDAILIKDNHVRIAGGIEPALAAVRASGSDLPVEIEADTLDQVAQALHAGAERILLDNMSPAEAARAVELVARACAARGLGRHRRGERPRLRRDRRRLHLDRRADARRALAPRLPGGHMTTSTIEGSRVRELQEEIRELARTRDAVILAHNYQVAEVQDVADFVGDSLGLSRQAAAHDASTIAFCGVHFMAETAAILAPEKTVLIPDLRAGCSLAASITADDLRAWKGRHPGAVVVSYVNTSADVKAESDYCCTSGNARAVIESIPADQKILFLPDLFLGLWLEKVTGRRLVLWMGECHVHAGIRPEDIERWHDDDPDAELLVHPECGCASQAMAYSRRADAHPLDRGDGAVRGAVAQEELHHRDRGGHHPPAREGRPGQDLRPAPQGRRLPVHEDDHPREPARCPAGQPVRGHRPAGRPPTGRGSRSSAWSRSAEPQRMTLRGVAAGCGAAAAGSASFRPASSSILLCSSTLRVSRRRLPPERASAGGSSCRTGGARRLR